MRTILRTIDGKIVVRPESKDVEFVQLSDKLIATLNDEGRKRWDSGQELDSSCYDCYLDISKLKEINL